MSLRVDLQHRFDGFELDAKFEAPKGVTALFGPSGSGKTTVVNALAGLMTPQSGSVVLEDEVLFNAQQGLNIAPHKRAFGYVFQDARLFPHMSVAANLDYGRRMRGHAKERTLWSHTIEMLGIERLLDRYPTALSGGEKQRVAIGRALLSGPKMLLLDEPLAALDADRRDEILPTLERLRDEAQMPILYVSHSVSEVARLATTIVAMKSGRVLHTGPAAEVFADPQSADAIGPQMMGALLKARAVQHHEDGLTELSAAGGTLWLPQISAQIGAEFRVRVRAQDIMLSLKQPQDISALNVLAGQIVAIKAHGGAGALVQLNCGGCSVLAQITQRSAKAMNLAVGQTVYAVLKSVSVAHGDIGAATTGAHK